MVSRILKKISNLLDIIIKNASIYLLIAITLLLFATVILRFCFNKTIVWQPDVSLILLAWIIFLGMSLAFKHGGNISVTVLENILPAKGCYVLRQVINVFCLIFLCIIVYKGFEVVKSTWNVNFPSIRICKGIFYLSLPVGGIASIFHVLVRTMELRVSDIVMERQKGATAE